MNAQRELLFPKLAGLLLLGLVALQIQPSQAMECIAMSTKTLIRQRERERDREEQKEKISILLLLFSI